LSRTTESIPTIQTSRKHDAEVRSTDDAEPARLTLSVMHTEKEDTMIAIRDLFYLLVKDYWENIQKLCSLSSLTGKENRFTALIHFKDYAYERNISGAASVYREVAGVALSCLQTGTWLNDREAEIWNRFNEECKIRGKKGIKPNIRVNPLKRSKGENKNLFTFVRDTPHDEDETIAAWAFRMISEGRIKEAHSKLKTVWGIGDKIASFYLRDIFWLGHGLNPQTTVEADYLLQPIDRWVQRAGEALGYTRAKLAESISKFEKENNIAHGGANIGFWMLGSNYLRDEKKFTNVLEAISNKTPDVALALSIADRFEKFGSMLRNIILHNNGLQPLANKSGLPAEA
jgi:hypothetical protein